MTGLARVPSPRLIGRALQLQKEIWVPRDIMLEVLPRYRDLPLSVDGRARHAWGVFGADDQVGTLNLLTPERVRHAITLVQRGEVIPLNLSLDLPHPPLSGRHALRHGLSVSDIGSEDWYDDFYPQASSQWDGLAHCAHPSMGFYNGHRASEITGGEGSALGIEHWAERGIVGRFVLVDVDRYRTASRRSIDCRLKDVITIEDVESCLQQEGAAIQTGDVLLLRTGWLTWYKGTDQATRLALAADLGYSTPGLECTERAAEWLWDRHVAAVVADNPGVEAVPVIQDTVEHFLHFRLIPLLGLALGELFDLDLLASRCAELGFYEGLFTASPFNKAGGSASVSNALALL
jgi:kynurenine formamidase